MASEKLTISEAAILLGVNPDTVRNRIQDGTYRAEKMVTERGPTWMIDRSSLIAETSPGTTSQQPVRMDREEAIQALAREIVREAGLQRDPQQEVKLEANRFRVEAYKTQVTIGTGALVATGAVGSFVPSPDSVIYLVLAFTCNLFSLLLAFGAMHSIAQDVQSSEATSTRRSALLAGGSIMALALGITSLIFFLSFKV